MPRIVIELIFMSPVLSDSYRQPISQIRKISKIFRKSPVRDNILQNYIKQEQGKEFLTAKRDGIV
jgi:hypothetical protein